MNEVNCTTEITLLRHGECEGGKIFRGSTDVKLSEKGWQQMQSRSSNIDCELLVTSPMRRCQEFAEDFVKQKNITHCVDERWREMSFGLWEGQEIAQVWQDDEARILAWSQNPLENTPPEGESLTEVAQRVEEAMADLFQQHRGKKILLVSHGGTIRVILAHVLKMHLNHVNRFDIPYAGTAKIMVYHTSSGDHIKLVCLNA